METIYLPMADMLNNSMQKKYYLSACCILKDEDPFIMEWLTYHSLIGVEHFFIYDNESASPLGDNPLIAKFAAQGKVTLLDAPGKTMQLPAYLHCLQTFGPQTKWLAYLDLDEFICLEKASDMRPILGAYEAYSALGLNWKCFSSSGHLSSPKGLVMDNYRERFLHDLERNLHIKSVIQPEKNYDVHTSHSFYPNDGEVAVGVDFRPMPPANAMIPISWGTACVHHYILKSQQDAQRRMVRGRADIASDRPTIDYNDFYEMVVLPVRQDESIVRFIPEVQGWLKAGELPESHAENLHVLEQSRLISIAEAMIKAGNLNDTGIILCHAALRSENEPRLWQLRASLAGLLGDKDQAERFALKAVQCKLARKAPTPDGPEKQLKELSPEQGRKFMVEVVSLAMAQKFAEAGELLTRLEKEYKSGTNLLLMRGTLARQQKDFKKAEEYFYKALGIEEIPQTYQELAQLRIDEGKLDEARNLVFYILHTGTFRVTNPDFYKPLVQLYELLKMKTGGGD